MNQLEARRRLLGRNVYKRTTEGNPAIAQGSLARMYPGITMQGWTEQPQYEGKNLLPVDVGQEFTGMVVTDSATFEEDGVHAVYKSIVSGEARDIYMYGNNNNSVESGYVEIPSLTPGDYRLVNDNIGISLYVVVWRNGASVILGYANNVSTKITVQNGDKFRIFLRCNVIGDTNVKIHPMIVKEGDDAAVYEPYTGGQLSPNPDYPQAITSAGKYNEETQKYEYQVKLTGKNLIPTYSEYSDWMSEIYKYIPVSGFTIGETYTFSQSVVPELGEGFYVALGTVAGRVDTGTVYWIYHSIAQNLCVKSITFVATQETYYLNVLGFTSTNMSRFLSLFPDLMVELGTERTEYQPYKEQTVHLTSDRPLTKWDKLEKRNGQWGWVYKSGSYTVTGEEDYTSSIQYIGERSCNAYFMNPELTDTTSNRNDGYCNSLERHPALWIDNSGIVGFSYNGHQTHIRISNSETGATKEDPPSDVAQKIKAYAARKYEEGNPFIFWYETAEETFVPLSESEQEQMNALYTFRPTTVLSNDCECEMTLTYKTKKSLEVAT